MIINVKSSNRMCTVTSTDGLSLPNTLLLLQRSGWVCRIGCWDTAQFNKIFNILTTFSFLLTPFYLLLMTINSVRLFFLLPSSV
jgi:hypothetical protein